MTDIEVRKAVTMYVKGTPISQIAREFGVSDPAIRYRVKRSKRGSSLIPYSEKESFISEKAKKMAAKEIGKLANLEESTTRNYACARHISLEYDHIKYTPLELKEIEKFIQKKSSYETISELATAFNRPYGSVYGKVAAISSTITFAQLVNNQSAQTTTNINKKNA